MIAPTLLVGLGGAGSKIVCQVSKLVTKEQRGQIGFAVFDTDINELREIEEANPFIKTIQTSTKLSVGEYLNIDTHARDSWFPVNAILNSKTLTEGAGQVRAISRLALDTAIRAGKMELLHETIQELYRIEEGKAEQALRVIIVSSLAGGTGSGLILPVALYIKNYLATRFRQNANITRGFFILPEVFEEVIPGQSERNSLRSNAYATLRELDAFLMKGDATLPDKYSNSVKLEFPRVGSTGFEEYDVRPYDFCFLFDAQNSEGSKLNSFNQYLDHAANCIYAQSIGPMNKRSNSSEDNTIRRLTAERGRNRYAGAGSSMLIYPFEDVKEYIALNWAKESVSQQWLVFDNMYKELAKRNRDMRSKGYNVQDLNPAQNYIDTVEQMAKDKKPFARSIVNACTIYDGDGITKVSDSWDDYVAHLKKKVTVDMSSGQSDLDAQRQNAATLLASLSEKHQSWDDYKGAYMEIEKYRTMIVKRSEDTASTIGYMMFKAPSDSVTSERLPHQLETYLRDGERKFIHPNAVRYFLYKALKLMKDECAMIEAQNRKDEEFFDGFAKNWFDDPKTEDVVETIDSLSEKKIPLFSKLTGKPSGEQEDHRVAYTEFLSKANAYRVNYILAAVLQEGIDYINGLCEAFQSFYLSFGEKVASVEERIALIAKKYENTKGTTARYVCASSKCLKKMAEQMPYLGSSITIDSDLADDIYSKVRKYSLLPNKPANNKYFSDIFELGILEYFKSSLMEKYSDTVDIDIIAALENEVKYEQDEYEDSRIEQYVKRTISETRTLSNPFIERPLGEQRDPINACAYSPSLNPHDESPRSMLIDKELKNTGGVEDDDIAKNMILFYQSFYGLRANDLSKFAPPERSMTSRRGGGEYYKAYYELIATIHPEPHLSKAITPHIDRWWHVVTKMPDLDESSQILQEHDIYAAFFWGIVGDYIDLYDTGAEHKTYRLKVDDLNMEEGSDELIVSNGTACDRFYEVLDALSIYPELVQKILARVDNLTTEDVNMSSTTSVEEGMLCGFLQTFRVKEYPLGEDNGVRSIFDVPMLMKKSITSDSYYEENVLKILKAEIAEIKKYLRRFCTDKELPDVMGDILRDQFAKYLADIELESKHAEGIYHDYLFSRTCSIIAKAFEDLGLRKDVKMIQQKVAELSK